MTGDRRTEPRRSIALMVLIVAAVVAAVGIGAFVVRYHPSSAAPVPSAAPGSGAARTPTPGPSAPSPSSSPPGSSASPPSSTSSDRAARDHWLADVSAALRGGSDYLVAHRGVSRPALVLDIDNTALESHYFSGRATPAVLSLERTAVRSGYSILFATGRAASSTGSVAALTKAGYRVDALCKRPSKEVEVQVSKANCRANWARAGYTIVADVGNRSTDFMGGHTGRVFALPNYGFLS